MKAFFSKEDFGLRSIIAAAAFSGLSAVTGLVKLPSPIGSVAFDSAPGFFAAGFVSPVVGGLVGFAGHLASAATAGFPSGPLHLAVAVGMLVTCFAYGLIVRLINRTWGVWVGSAVGIVLNCLIPFACVPLGLPTKVALALVFPFLVVAAAANTFIASALLVTFAKMRAPGV